MKDIGDYLGIQYFSYSGLEYDLYKIIKLIGSEVHCFYDEIVEKTGLDEKFVLLIQEILCSADLAEYGISPRGCWLTPKGEEFLKKLPGLIKERHK